MSQPLWHSIPYLCILLPLGSAAVTSVLKPRWARYWTMFALLVVTSLSGVIPPFSHPARRATPT